MNFENNDALNELKNFNSRRLSEKLLLSDIEFEMWLQKLGLLWSERTCICGSAMSKRTLRINQSKSWRCKKKSCRREKGYYEGTVFEGTHLSLKEVFQLSYYWCRQTHTIKEVQFEMQRRNSNISKTTIVYWNNLFRETCTLYFSINPIAIGGVNSTVEIDETCISKRKYNRGRMIIAQQWFFGGVERGTENCFIVPVNQRNAQTLLPILQQYVLPGTTIVSDFWRAYINISNLPENYTHLCVNHQLHFVDPDSGAHTQTIEGTWMHFKRRHKEEMGTSRSHFASYVDQFIWRKKFSGPDCLFYLWKNIRILYLLN